MTRGFCNFDFSAYADRDVVVHCASEEEATVFCKMMFDAGLTWASGDSYLRKNYYSNYKDTTCYRFNRGAIGSFSYYQELEFEILEFADLFCGDGVAEISDESIMDILSS